MSLVIETAHRPFPPPSEPWIAFQSWRHLLFAHWPVAPTRLRSLVPRPLEVETFGGAAWVGVTPFLLVGQRPRGLPPLPYLSTFPEVNVRTYVRLGPYSGVWFFSLDAARFAAVLGARALYRLPYHAADMSLEPRDGGWHFRSRRRDHGATLEVAYRPTGPAFNAARGSLEYFLTERYVLFSVTGTGRVLRGDIHHDPWPLQPATADIHRDSLTAAAGIPLPDHAPVLHFADRQDTRVWRPRIAD